MEWTKIRLTKKQIMMLDASIVCWIENLSGKASQSFTNNVISVGKRISKHRKSSSYVLKLTQKEVHDIVKMLKEINDYSEDDDYGLLKSIQKQTGNLSGIDRKNDDFIRLMEL